MKSKNRSIRIGIIGDFNPNYPSHRATNESLSHAATTLAKTVDVTWIPTESLDVEASEKILQPYDALWGSPGSPYKSMDGALRAIRFAREKGWPFIGT